MSVSLPLFHECYWDDDLDHNDCWKQQQQQTDDDDDDNVPPPCLWIETTTTTTTTRDDELMNCRIRSNSSSGNSMPRTTTSRRRSPLALPREPSPKHAFPKPKRRVSWWLISSNERHSPGSSELQLIRTTLENDRSGGPLLCMEQAVVDNDMNYSDNYSDNYSRCSSDDSSQSTVDLLQSQQDLLCLSQTDDNKVKVMETAAAACNKKLDLARYMAQRQMTATQERANALTMLPGPAYCFYFLQQQQHDDDDACSIWPWPVLVAAAGICLHAPFSFLYHWKFAHTLPGTARTTHWSRRMDQSMIHVSSACLSYGLSGSWDYAMANCLYNAECIYRQFRPKVRPRRNKIRILISIVAYTLPIFRRGDLETFVSFWAILAVGSWLFVSYPVGGWSHACFHMVAALAPPLLLMAAQELPESIAMAEQAAAACRRQGL